MFCRVFSTQIENYGDFDPESHQVKKICFLNDIRTIRCKDCEHFPMEKMISMKLYKGLSSKVNIRSSTKEQGKNVDNDMGRNDNLPVFFSMGTRVHVASEWL